ncbi:heme NO-binding domain-containing protein [Teredinibacter haidensis]|uniref:heme NO-binding domain-containing protein n=1 Tax=Teredinibacter haidensis TaxID=2731755 RepID=UPI000948AF3D|nr:heme NO-binding domain-containing protein [Teredinibacter haidensis]
MKGAVFIALNDMIETEYGINAWESILDKVKPESEGIYASASSYRDEEVVDLVVAIAEYLGADPHLVTRKFGHYLFSQLNSKFPIFTSLHTQYFNFLSSIEGVIHKEVRKLYQDAALPSIRCDQLNDSHIQMHYSSPRKLCFLAEGLVSGAAEHYGVNVDINQQQCVHKGANTCIIDIKLV